jgi:hypothetical protein
MDPTDESEPEPVRRCAAAHLDDPTPCEGDHKAVRILVGGDEVLACVHHGARLYASVDHPTVYPVGGPDGPNANAALEVPRRATGMRPFFWMAADRPPARTARHRLRRSRLRRTRQD